MYKIYNKILVMFVMLHYYTTNVTCCGLADTNRMGDFEPPHAGSLGGGYGSVAHVIHRGQAFRENPVNINYGRFRSNNGIVTASTTYGSEFRFRNGNDGPGGKYRLGSDNIGATTTGYLQAPINAFNGKTEPGLGSFVTGGSYIGHFGNKYADHAGTNIQTQTVGNNVYEIDGDYGKRLNYREIQQIN